MRQKKFTGYLTDENFQAIENSANVRGVAKAQVVNEMFRYIHEVESKNKALEHELSELKKLHFGAIREIEKNVKVLWYMENSRLGYHSKEGAVFVNADDECAKSFKECNEYVEKKQKEAIKKYFGEKA